MTKHTPGPWKFGLQEYDLDLKKYIVEEKPFDYHGNGFCNNPMVLSDDGTNVVGCDEYYIFNSPEDARLITAAPELLLSCKELIKAIEIAIQSEDWKVDGACDPDNVIRFAKSIIYKATGGNDEDEDSL